MEHILQINACLNKFKHVVAAFEKKLLIIMKQDQFYIYQDNIKQSALKFSELALMFQNK